MHILKTPSECYLYILEQKKNNKRIGFVPTMGSLHQGHLSLIDLAKQHSDIVFLSIFVNPLQFSENEDYDTYPRTLKDDIHAAKEHGCDVVFCPSESQLLSSEINTQVYIPHIGAKYCGITRPHFFQGVCSIVLRLFNIVQPTIAVFGEKDYQQLIILRQMVKDLFLPIEIIPAPIIREEDGLAMSSRNQYLSSDYRKRASKIYEMMQLGVSLFQSGQTDSQIIINEMKTMLLEFDFRLDYLDIIDSNLDHVRTVKKKDRVLFAGYLDNCRLIDNKEF